MQKYAEQKKVDVVERITPFRSLKWKIILSINYIFDFNHKFFKAFSCFPEMIFYIKFFNLQIYLIFIKKIVF